MPPDLSHFSEIRLARQSAITSECTVIWYLSTSRSSKVIRSCSYRFTRSIQLSTTLMADAVGSSASAMLLIRKR